MSRGKEIEPPSQHKIGALYLVFSSSHKVTLSYYFTVIKFSVIYYQYTLYKILKQVSLSENSPWKVAQERFAQGGPTQFTSCHPFHRKNLKQKEYKNASSETKGIEAPRLFCGIFIIAL